MSKNYAPFFSLLLSTGILLVGNGLNNTLISVRGDIENFSGTIIGMFGAFYYAGFFLGSFQCSRIVKRAGHIRAFAAFASMASVSPLVHSLFPNEVLWMILRALTGYCFAGLFLIIESWLNEQATNETRGRLFGIYLVINFISMTLGQLILNLASPSGSTLFILASILVSISLLPLTLTKSVQPSPITSSKINILALWKMSSIATTGCLVVGIVGSTFWALAPVFLRESGLNVKSLSFFMSAYIFGGAVAQFPIGFLSDRIDRRWVIALVTICAAGAEATLVIFSGKTSEFWFLMMAFGLGAFSLCLYSICVAQANDHTKEGDFVVVSGGLLVMFSIGAVFGPLVNSIAMLFISETYIIFIFSGIAHGALGIYVLISIAKFSPILPEERREFVAVPLSRTGPDPIEFDPRIES
jgi:MFS family permease